MVLLRLQVIAKGNIQIGSICIQHAPTARLLQHPLLRGRAAAFSFSTARWLVPLFFIFLKAHFRTRPNEGRFLTVIRVITTVNDSI